MELTNLLILGFFVQRVVFIHLDVERIGAGGSVGSGVIPTESVANMDNTGSSVAGINAPYIQLLACRKT